jgi:PilZ domain
MRERRQVPRYKFSVKGRLTSASNEILSEVTMTTLSVAGCRVKGPDVPGAGKKCRLEFEWEGRQFQDDVEVKWKRPNGEAGFTFVSLEDANLQLIRRVCATLHMEPLAPEPPESEEE